MWLAYVTHKLCNLTKIQAGINWNHFWWRLTHVLQNAKCSAGGVIPFERKKKGVNARSLIFAALLAYLIHTSIFKYTAGPEWPHESHGALIERQYHLFLVSCSAVANTIKPYFTHHHYCCKPPADNAENLRLEFLHESHSVLLFFPLSLSHSKLNPSGFHTFPLCFATTFCLSLVLPSLLVPLSELHDRVPVYVRRASSQSAVKALILLVAIYYPVVCVKKKRERLKASWAWVQAAE